MGMRDIINVASYNNIMNLGRLISYMDQVMIIMVS